MNASKSFVANEEAKPVPQLAGLERRTLVWGNQMLLVEFTMAKGTLMPMHTHVHEQVGYVARGRVEFVVASEKRLLEAGAGYCISSNVPHEAYAVEDTVVVDVFTPVRQEYLP